MLMNFNCIRFLALGTSLFRLTAAAWYLRFHPHYIAASTTPIITDKCQNSETTKHFVYK